MERHYSKGWQSKSINPKTLSVFTYNRENSLELEEIIYKDLIEQNENAKNQKCIEACTDKWIEIVNEYFAAMNYASKPISVSKNLKCKKDITKFIEKFVSEFKEKAIKDSNINEALAELPFYIQPQEYVNILDWSKTNIKEKINLLSKRAIKSSKASSGNQFDDLFKYTIVVLNTVHWMFSNSDFKAVCSILNDSK